MRRVAVLSDSTCDLSKDMLESYAIGINPLYTVLDDQQYKDLVEITPDEVYAYVTKNGKLPKTAASSIGDHIEFFRPYAEQGMEIVYFTISAQMSANNNNARIAAEEFENVYVIDSENLSTGIGLQVLRAAELAQAGKSAKEIYEDILEMRRRIDVSFVIETVDYLYKGGRCSAVAALGANLLKLRPCIEVKDGKMGVGKKYRGKMTDVLQQYAKARLADIENIETDRIFITHSGCDEQTIQAVYDVVAQTGHFKEILVTRAGCTISVHCGPGTLGVLFVHKKAADA